MRLLIAAAASILATSASAEQIWLSLDQVKPYDLPKPAGQIVVGNPAIADVTVQDKTRVLFFGKAPGITNMYIFDEDGAVIDNLIVRVQSATGEMLTMHRGPMRTTYNCASHCEATATVGDSATSFAEVSQQVTTRLQQATNGPSDSQ